VKDTFFINDYVAILDEVKGVREVDGMALNEGDAAAQATVRILDKDATVTVHPTFVIKNREVWSKPEVNNELGLRIQLNKIDPQSGKFSFTSSRTQREYIVMKALEKPQQLFVDHGVMHDRIHKRIELTLSRQDTANQ